MNQRIVTVIPTLTHGFQALLQRLASADGALHVVVAGTLTPPASLLTEGEVLVAAGAVALPTEIASNIPTARLEDMLLSQKEGQDHAFRLDLDDAYRTCAAFLHHHGCTEILILVPPLYEPIIPALELPYRIMTVRQPDDLVSVTITARTGILCLTSSIQFWWQRLAAGTQPTITIGDLADVEEAHQTAQVTLDPSQLNLAHVFDAAKTTHLLPAKIWEQAAMDASRSEQTLSVATTHLQALALQGNWERLIHQAWLPADAALGYTIYRWNNASTPLLPICHGGRNPEPGDLVVDILLGSHDEHLWGVLRIKLSHHISAGDCEALTTWKFLIENVIHQEQRRNGESFWLQQRTQRQALIVRSIGHDLRSTIHSMRSYTHLLQQRIQEVPELEEELVWLDRLKVNGETMLGMITDLVDLSSSTLGTLRLRIEPLNLTTIIRNTIERIQQRFPNQPTIHADFPTNPLHILGDHARTQQIIHTLILFALQTTREQSIKLDLDITSGLATLDLKVPGVPFSFGEILHVLDGRHPTGEEEDRETLITSSLALPLSQNLLRKQGGTFVVHMDEQGTLIMRVHFPLYLHLHPPAEKTDPSLYVQTRVALATNQDTLAEHIRTLLAASGYEIQQLPLPLPDELSLALWPVLLLTGTDLQKTPDLIQAIRARPDGHLPILLLGTPPAQWIPDQTTIWIERFDSQHIVEAIESYLTPPAIILACTPTGAEPHYLDLGTGHIVVPTSYQYVRHTLVQMRPHLILIEGTPAEVEAFLQTLPELDQMRIPMVYLSNGEGESDQLANLHILPRARRSELLQIIRHIRLKGYGE